MLSNVNYVIIKSLKFQSVFELYYNFFIKNENWNLNIWHKNPVE